MALYQDKQHDLKIYIVQKVKKGSEEKQCSPHGK